MFYFRKMFLGARVAIRIEQAPGVCTLRNIALNAFRFPRDILVNGYTHLRLSHILITPRN